MAEPKKAPVDSRQAVVPAVETEPVDAVAPAVPVLDMATLAEGDPLIEGAAVAAGFKSAAAVVRHLGYPANAVSGVAVRHAAVWLGQLTGHYTTRG